MEAGPPDSPKRKPVIGLIGGMGSGKSLVAAELARRGARLISGDRLGHEALKQPDVQARVVERWGPAVLDERGEVDRRKLGAIVFADERERQALEALVFPTIERGIREAIAAARSDPEVKLVVLDAAIMVEAGWDGACDRLVFVDAPGAARLRRLADQRGWSAKEVDARENAQMPLAKKKERADYVLDNSGTPEQLARQVEDLWRHLQQDL
jgi:dephospho-CoA kinase